MDIVVQQQGMTVDLLAKIKNITEICKIARLEELLSNCLESMPTSSPIDYIGELNKNDIMH